jgi:ribosome biogenesis GTPase
MLVDASGPEWKLKEGRPRWNEFTRKVAGQRVLPQTVAANLDQVFIVASASSPATPFGLIDRLLVTGSIGNVPSIVLINKSDLCSPEREEQLRLNYQAAGIEPRFISARTGQGIDNVIRLTESKISLLVGSSGVGKTSLVNLFTVTGIYRTGEVSASTGKGRHVTTAASLYSLSGGGWIIDTPGIREWSPWNMNFNSLVEAYPEISRHAPDCRFRNCNHIGDAGCAVQEALKTGSIPLERYSSYRKLLEEAGIEKRRAIHDG